MDCDDLTEMKSGGRGPTSFLRRNLGALSLQTLLLWGVGMALNPGTLSGSVLLNQLSPTLYQTEHCLFIVDSSVTWSSPTAAYNDIYAAGPTAPYFPRLSGYFDTLTARFPGNYFSICYIANTGASNVPNYIDRIYKATGISNGLGSAGLGSSGVAGTPQSFATVDFCRYNLPGGNVISPVLAVFDHEIGHAWGAQIFYTLNQPSLSNGHWLGNATVDCQLGNGASTDGYLTVDKIQGDPVHGFTWQRVNNNRSNDTEVFSEQALYLMGVAPVFPTSYVLNNPVYNSDGTMGCSSVDIFDHAAAVATYGVRNPDYKTSPKQFRLGFVYIARDVAEVNTVYQAVEQSIDHFCNGETISTTSYRSQTPFLADSRYRASVDGLLSELDGNARPVLTINTPYITSADGTATIGFSASDPDGPAPAVSIIPASSHCIVSGATVQVSGLPDGVHFFTLKAVDAGNKKAFAHFTVEVQRPASSVIIASDPISQIATAGSVATLTVTADAGASSLTYHWFLQAAKTSTWNSLSDGAAYGGTGTPTLLVAAAPTMDGDAFLCLVSDGTGSASSRPAVLTINEVPPLVTTQPVDKNIIAGASTYFNVTAGNSATTFGYYEYQWQRQAAGSGTWVDLTASSTYAGVTQAQLTIYNSTLGMNTDQFRCLVANTAGATASSAALLAVGSAPAITLQPLPASGLVGQTVSFTVAASGTGPLYYQWYKYSTPVGNAATLTLTNLQLSDAGTYGVHVTNPFGLAYSTNVGLSVNPAISPVINVPLQSVHGSVGQDLSLTVVPSGSAPFTYQWRKEGVAIAGATAATLALTAVQASDAGHYDVVITNAAGSVVSNAVTVDVDPPVIIPPTNAVITIFVS